MLIQLGQTPDGQLGNRLFSYNLVRQLAFVTRSSYLFPGHDDSTYFSGIRSNAPHENNSKIITLKREDLVGSRMGDLVELIKKSKPQVIKLYPPFLGEIFFDYTNVCPSIFLQVRERFSVIPEWRKKFQIVIGVHFRGGDFFSWNPSAILSLDYYINAIEFALRKINHSKVCLILFTDDLNLESFKGVQEYFSKLNSVEIVNGRIGGHPIVDFLGLTLVDYLVSSPSTFAIWGGVLNKNVKIIHSKNWVNQQSEAGDLFWQQLRSGGNKFYRAWDLI